jgi:hypothetical protein
MIKTWQERCEEHPDHEGIVTEQMIRDRMQEEIDALRQAIEQAEKQEPSLWFAIGKNGRVKYTTDSDRALKWKQAGSYRLVRDYYTSPVHASDISQERVDETAKCGRKWVGLTDEERAECWSTSAVQSALNIEAKLKEKNCPSAD